MTIADSINAIHDRISSHRLALHVTLHGSSDDPTERYREAARLAREIEADREAIDMLDRNVSAECWSSPA